jgi:hypothetical protein
LIAFARNCKRDLIQAGASGLRHKSTQSIASGVLRLSLSREADRDLESIVDYGTREHGEAAADAYYLRLLAAFDFLCATPFAGQFDEATGLNLRR